MSCNLWKVGGALVVCHVISGKWAELWMCVSCNLWKVGGALDVCVSCNLWKVGGALDVCHVYLESGQSSGCMSCNL